jgi:hypothetical protein
MEACSNAHYWGRQCQALDLVPVLLPQYARPYRVTTQNSKTL